MSDTMPDSFISTKEGTCYLECWSHRNKFVAPESGIFVFDPEEEGAECLDMPCREGCPLMPAQ